MPVPRMALLSRKGLLAIAAVIDVALHGRGGPVSAKVLAERHALPARHLEPVLQALVRVGILKGIRGPLAGAMSWPTIVAASPPTTSCVPPAPSRTPATAPPRPARR